MKNRYHLILLGLFLIFSNVALFATNNEVQLSDTLPDLMVVQSREQLLQISQSNLPTTFYSRRIEQQHIEAPKDFSAYVPSLFIPDYGSAMTSTIYMRGLGARIDNPVVGVYIDGVGIANKNALDFHFLDMRSAEIYRGPQGTLFGRNTIGGIISLHTISPLSYQGTKAKVSYANQNTALAQVSHYHAINDRLGLAAGVYYTHTDGYFKNLYDGKLTDWKHQTGAMLKIDSRPTDKLAISNNLTYNFVKQGAFPYHLENQPVNHNGFCGYQRHSLIEGLNMEVKLGEYTLGSTTTYQLLRDIMDMDQDYLPLSYFTMQQRQLEHYAEQNFTLKPTEKHDIWNWIAGLSVSYKHNTMSAPVNFLKQGIDSLILANANVFGDVARFDIAEDQFTINSDFKTSNADVALYHTSYVTLNDWQIEAGLRLDYEHSIFHYDSHGQFHYNFTPYIPDYRLLDSHLKGDMTLQYLEVLPRLAASYNKKNWNVFASIAEGYKAGGFNTQLFSDLVRNEMMQQMMQRDAKQDISSTITYKPERCLTSEIGATYRYADNNWRVNTELRIYDNELFNQQLTVFPSNTTGRMMTNAGRSRSIGAELTAFVQYNGLEINLSYAYTYARFLKYQSGSRNYAGRHIPYVPDHVLAANVAYRWTFNHDIVNSLTLSLQEKTIGPIFWDEANQHRQKLYALLGADITLSMRYVSISLWGQNLTNTQYNVFYFESMNNAFMQSGKPITYGTTIRFEI